MFKRVESIEELHNILRTIREAELNPKISLQPAVYLVTIQKFRRGSEELVGIESLLNELGKRYLEYLRDVNIDEYNKVIAELEQLRPEIRHERMLELGSIKHRYILILIDEAHRSQYGILATMLKMAMPNAIRIGFTGTPVLEFDKNTFREFAYPDQGELYLDVYSISDSIRDGFTVPITYQVVNTEVKINVTEDDIREVVKELEDAMSEGIDPEELFEKVSEVYRGINNVRVILSNRERICEVARYIVDRLENDLGASPETSPFKAMVVAVNRTACIYYKRCLDEYLQRKYGDTARDWVEVVMSYGNNDPKEIREYRQELRERFPKMDIDEINREITRRFREDAKPKILVVTEMLLAGFDSPNLKVLYLDKPLIAHRLLQAMARVNRPFKVITEEGEVEIKGSGLIVDFIGLLKHLIETQAFYETLARENPQNIRYDFTKYALEKADSLFNDFVSLFNDVKTRLRNLTLLDRRVEVNIDELRSMDVVAMRNSLIGAAGLIVSAINGVEGYEKDSEIAGKLLNDISRVIGMYRALGAYPRKLSYEKDIRVLKVLYGLVMIMMRRGDTELDISRIREELYDLIYDRTVVEEITELAAITITHEDFDKLISTIKTETAPEEVSDRSTSRFIEAWLYLNNKVKPHIRSDPIYRQIYEKLREIINKWVSRKITIIEALKLLNQLMIQLEDYERRTAAQPPSTRIAYALSDYISRNYLGGKNVGLRLQNAREVIDKVSEEVSTYGILSQSDVREIKKAVLMDIFRELGNILSESTKRELSMSMDRLFDDLIRPYIENYVKMKRVQRT